MDLRNGNITVAEVLSYPPARNFLASKYPALVHHPMLRMAGRFTLNQALAYAGDALRPNERQMLIEKLSSL